MFKEVRIAAYRKLKNITLTFSNGVNLISGVNGTCKSSLLHIIGNSFQSVKRDASRLSDVRCVSVIAQINSWVNPKIEALTRGDKRYKDPGNGLKGTLYTVKYANGISLDFRRHNSKSMGRFAVKPKYSRGSNEQLPSIPVVYLGLSRLYPYGEIHDDEHNRKIRKNLPTQYIDSITNLYDRFLHIKINDLSPQDAAGYKKRGTFSSSVQGVDDNTISSGEENVLIILTALESLHYYHDSLSAHNDYPESILLIDEFDATLHPSLQVKLLEIIRKYSVDYKIQCVMTTHSISLLERALKLKDNVIYLRNNIEDIQLLENPTIYKIEAALKVVTDSDLYPYRKIPIVAEDAEARLFVSELFERLKEVDNEFARVASFFQIVEENFGGDSLKKIFSNEVMHNAMHAVCVLDGDKKNGEREKLLSSYITTLPGHEPPECLLARYAKNLFEKVESSFWDDASVLDGSFSREWYLENVKEDACSLVSEYDSREHHDKTLRENFKNHFNKHNEFYRLVMRHYIRHSPEQINEFFSDIFKLFKKTAEFHRIDSKKWRQLNHTTVAPSGEG